MTKADHAPKTTEAVALALGFLWQFWFWRQSIYVALAVLDLTEIVLPLPPQCWDKACMPPYLAPMMNWWTQKSPKK